MADDASVSRASPFTAILEWSRAWPVWQQDALRRIVVTGDLTKQTWASWRTSGKIKHGLAPASVTTVAMPLTEMHIPGGPDTTCSISLLRLSN